MRWFFRSESVSSREMAIRHRWLAALSVESSILEAIHAQNVRRMFRLAIIMAVVHALHVAVFLAKDVEADETVLLWRNGIIYSHAITGCLVVLYAVLCRPGRNPSSLEASLYATTGTAMYLIFGAVVAAIDQLVTPALTPFMVASIGIGATILLPPYRSFPLFIGAIILVGVAAGYTQESAEKLLSLRVNALSMGMIGAGINWVLFLGKVRELKHLRTIEDQRKDLTIKNRTLVRVNETRDRFLAIVAHDLRGPIGSQADAIDVLAGEYDTMTDAERLAMLHSLKRSMRRSYELLEELLKWTRSRTGHIPFRPEAFPLLTLIQETVDLLSENARQKNIDVCIQASESPEVYADRSMIHSVLGNLIGNAIKFTPRGGSVTIDLQSEGPFCTVSVVDSGIGIRPDLQMRIFQEGEPMRTTGTEGESGTGLGLVISRQFVERNGGRLAVESRPHAGSRFYFTLLTVPHRSHGVSSD